MQLEEIVRSGLDELKIPYNDSTIGRLRIYSDYLAEMNKVMNLTAIEGDEATAKLHFLDCAALPAEEDISGKRVIDVGTGAGFPGMVLKILCPDISLTLLDSLDKRIGFLKNTCEKLGFEGVDCIHARAEEAPKELRESFDIATSRAVARLNLLCELCLPFVKKGGLFISLKSTDHADELKEAEKAIKQLGGKLEKVVNYTIPGTDVTHSLIFIRKVAPTPARFPRRWAQIKKQPL